MVPGGIVMLEEMPVTASGKVDRQRLPEPELVRGEGDYQGGRTAVEGKLVEMWQGALRVREVGIDDNFFELGGDSILSIQIVARASRAGLRLTPKQIFDHQTIRELAEVCEERGVVREGEAEVRGEVALTPIQRWFFGQGRRRPDHFNQSVLLELKRGIDAERLRQVVEEWLRRHDALRLRFRREEEGWRQSYAEQPPETPFSVISLSEVAENRRVEVIEEINGRMQESLDLAHGPLLRVVAMDLGAERGGRLMVVVHHLVVDGVSWRILLEELQMGYQQLKG